MKDWSRAYDNVAAVEGAAAYPARWAAAAEAFRAAAPAGARIDLAYGDHDRERFDLFAPEDPTSRGLMVIIHGGYWRRFDKNLFSHLALGPLAHGWSVAAPSYPLAPEARIGDVVRSVGAAVATAAKLVDGPIRLVGHSAGGHLATRMICRDAPLPDTVQARIEHVVSISGVHDLRPLLKTDVNVDLKLDLVEARAESPALLEPVDGAQVTCWVGADELPEFLRQNELLTMAWRGFDVAISSIEELSRHHFNVILGLSEPDSPLARVVST